MPATKTPTRTLAAAPERTTARQMEALKKANEIRTARAQWKRDVKVYAKDPLDVLAEPPAEFKTMKLFDVLMAMPKVGRVKANRLLWACRISPSKTVGGLSQRQRLEIVSLLGRRR